MLPDTIPRIQDDAFVKIMSLGILLYTIVIEPLERGRSPFRPLGLRSSSCLRVDGLLLVAFWMGRSTLIWTVD